MARDPKHCLILLQIGQMGSQLNASILRDRACELLDLIPSDQKILEKICQCKDKGGFKQLEEMCFQLPPLHTLYHLEVRKITTLTRDVSFFFLSRFCSRFFFLRRCLPTTSNRIRFSFGSSKTGAFDFF